ncbi:bifunctional phosphopantothenoylcysteine decarboxylase/phosphopantothenate--cysteine ligase CoaBC [Marinilactibacillus sp. XAAS-LB27]|uniref:bifunctional phosphopantothenoylcysteine decarboxylase/phosphopantothenate--cysteine ligase CoaBC n=1 Tax=Marinilactibacillus sp. XAAS-LB27 TaxID=3114538 RepID=UPI002E175FC4|nr:bifunctional phosphopantothenoylcysteine decarboxylase/phosphopantothenate--cysteine ligase CoaBC [Marinilactibacillus sp. XAAS-LB27]
MKDLKVAFYVTGGIAVYKSISLMRELIKMGADVQVAMTPSATEFVSPLTFQVLSKHAVHIDTFSEEDPHYVQHIHFADWADVSIVAPATANTIAKLANGMADNFVTSALLATVSPIFLVPAMNEHMLEHPATQKNIDTLRNRHHYVMEPETGFLAEGYSGKGRFPETDAIIEALEGFLMEFRENLPLKGKKVLITAGGTKERIDPVRFISNDSSGKMGHALAEAAWSAGAEVTLITVSDLPSRKQINRIQIDSAAQMYEAVNQMFQEIDVLIMAAAVSDYAPLKVEEHKMKKQDQLTIELKKNPDILKEMGKKKTKQFLIGFAAETENIETYALKKLTEKNADLIVANDVGKKDRGFNSNHNEVTIYSDTNQPVTIKLSKKAEIAQSIIEILIERLE